jgi:hypothetical protein
MLVAFDAGLWHDPQEATRPHHAVASPAPGKQAIIRAGNAGVRSIEHRTRTRAFEIHVDERMTPMRAIQRPIVRAAGRLEGDGKAGVAAKDLPGR